MRTVHEGVMNRVARIGVTLGMVISISGCERGGPLNDLAAGFRDTTIKPIERVLEGKSSEPGPLEKADAAYTRALPVLRGEASEAETPKLVADLFAAADAGHAPSENLLGMLHDRGRGFPKNPNDAAYWYRRAAEQNHAVAQFNLGALYRSGTGVPRDDDAAFGWFYGAAQQGHAEAQYQMALMLEDGIGRPRDPAQAVEWYRKSAEAGYAPAQHNLAVAYATGNGIAKNEGEAAVWYLRAADQGIAASQLQLGLALAQGRGIARDPAQAWVRFMQAAANPGANEDLRTTAKSEAGIIAVKLPPDQLEKARKELAGRQQARG